ncbi:Scarecrow-like protein 18 [Hibiscus syriacus]|uniref:Scarecrow-like protein 18 n=1 Tax=Hibiscus syriacus TaxID=106335 RepID=A0A6A2Y9Q9_HIBSY|nr:Scarecrow-like protein 18 [Hibiscus syriacus]
MYVASVGAYVYIKGGSLCPRSTPKPPAGGAAAVSSDTDASTTHQLRRARVSIGFPGGYPSSLHIILELIRLWGLHREISQSVCQSASLRINRLHGPGSNLLLLMNNINFPIAGTSGVTGIDPSLQSCYLSLNQALAERSANTLRPPPMLRITGTGHDLNILHRTGDRLFKFAQLLGLRFQFNSVLILNDDPSWIAANLHSMVTILPNEALAVNCMLYLHRLLKDDSIDLRLFLHNIKALNPTVVTVAEREANHNHPLFLQRFVEALDYYTGVFDSLEATLPPNSGERLAMEQIWFGREIVDIVAAEGENRRERHERLETWEVILRSSGFSNVALSPFAHSQAKLLLRLHYPSEGYQLQVHNNCFFLGWQHRPLFSVSSWH